MHSYVQRDLSGIRAQVAVTKLRALRFAEMTFRLVHMGKTRSAMEQTFGVTIFLFTMNEARAG